MVFFCDGYGDHRDLHVLTPSFPTRRSSDLRSMPTVNSWPPLDHQVQLFCTGSTLKSVWPSSALGAEAAASASGAAGSRTPADSPLAMPCSWESPSSSAWPPDRQSTRLNSSH